MGTKRARFCFVFEARDTRTTIVRVRTIQLEGEDTTYKFPENFTTKENHIKLFKTKIVKNVIKSLSSRGKFRKVWISVEEELKAQYLDEEGNVCYDGCYLNECRAYVDPGPVTTHSLEPSHEKITSRVKNMVIEKFSRKNQNATNFIELFVSKYYVVNIFVGTGPRLVSEFLKNKQDHATLGALEKFF